MTRRFSKFERDMINRLISLIDDKETIVEKLARAFQCQKEDIESIIETKALELTP